MNYADELLVSRVYIELLSRQISVITALGSGQTELAAAAPASITSPVLFCEFIDFLFKTLGQHSPPKIIK